MQDLWMEARIEKGSKRALDVMIHFEQMLLRLQSTVIKFYTSTMTTALWRIVVMTDYTGPLSGCGQCF